jgi:TRAP-type C4-dicarboxylate transport system permease large subunit
MPPKARLIATIFAEGMVFLFFGLCAIAKSDIWETTKVNLPFIAALLVVLLICTYVPWFSLVLVNLFYGTGGCGAAA